MNDFVVSHNSQRSSLCWRNWIVVKRSFDVKNQTLVVLIVDVELDVVGNW